MRDQLILERLEFQCRIGVSAEEREKAQAIGIRLELDYEPDRLQAIAETDDILRAVDYARIAERLVQISQEREYRLLETLAERLCRALFEEFSVSAVRIWVKKLRPPVKDLHGSAGVRLERTRLDQMPEPRPARFLVDQWRRFPKGDVLDVAAGRGRHALFLAAHGFSVDAVDRDERALAELTTSVRQRNLQGVRIRTMDLEADADRRPDVPKERYDVILVFFYLYRPVVPVLLEALKPRGILMYETFLIDNHLAFQHPGRREFCLAHNELLHLARGLRVLHYNEGEHETESGGAPAFTARLLAQKEA